MKKIIKAGLLAFVFSMVLGSVDAQRIYVSVRPARPAIVVKRPVAPAVGQVWVDEEWIPQGRTYVWRGGYWAAPPRANAVYVPGRWVHSKRGHVWVRGYWR
ncbi:BcpO-related WXXGXW repeat protein [Sediminibacterium roseum]|uniref:BcpO-related WXXGXW repeat protein n=1 Tax=Sediminibacterium roseum TaxID=1978412 RepID=A0ABW9ZX64_9BACT|nr:YXWGXW repeat-containing protein [Sediminibacterium roseum]NCI50638.1 BcpO-related WXXGXW repeat protein [Sediminibacterium roseum]